MRSACIVLASVVLACGGDEPGTGTSGVDTGTESDGHDDHGTASTSSGTTTSEASTGSESGSGTTSGEVGSSSDGSTSGGETASTGAAVDTWENWALPSFFAVYCNHCHPAAGQSARDFSDYDTVAENFEHIRCGVAPEAIDGCDAGHIRPGHLPIGPGPYPSDDERWRLVDWMDAGMPRD